MLNFDKQKHAKDANDPTSSPRVLEEHGEFHRPFPFQDVIEKNSDSIWAEFESDMIYPEFQAASETTALARQDDGWLVTSVHNEFDDSVNVQKSNKL